MSRSMTYLYKRVTDVCSFMLMAVLTSVATWGRGGLFPQEVWCNYANCTHTQNPESAQCFKLLTRMTFALTKSSLSRTCIHVCLLAWNGSSLCELQGLQLWSRTMTLHDIAWDSFQMWWWCLAR